MEGGRKIGREAVEKERESKGQSEKHSLDKLGTNWKKGRGLETSHADTEKLK